MTTKAIIRYGLLAICCLMESLIQADTIDQKTEGTCNPALSNIKGDIIINCYEPSKIHNDSIKDLPQETLPESKPVKLRLDVGLKKSPSAKEPSFCMLKASDYVLPLKIVTSSNKKWCKIRVVNSKKCNEGNEGFIRPNYLSTGCV